jgi:hypothetical protein
MMPQTINIKEYDQYSFSLSYDSNVPCVIMEIGGFMEGENFKTNTEKMFDLLISKGASKLVINAENMKLIRSEDCIWVEKTFLPKALTQGLRSCAFVIPKDASAKTTIENIVYPIPAPLLNARWFSTVDEAKNWLIEV